MATEGAADAGTNGNGDLRSGDDLLWRHLKTVPAFRALLRAVEARFYRRVAIPEPVLDLGCGDGHFAKMAFNRPLLAGVDPWWGPLEKAGRGGGYRLNVQALGNALPFSDGAFASVISNSVLEHIEEVEPVLAEAARVLRPSGRLVVTMPSHLFTEYLGGAALLRPLGMDDAYRRLFNFISRHAHTDPPERWAERLGTAGFRVTRWQYYFSKEALRALEVGHVQGLPSAALHALTGHWILGPWRENLRVTERWVRPYYEEEAPEEGAYLFLVAEKAASGPIRAALPEALPFSLEELQSAAEMEPEGRPEPALAAGVEGERGREIPLAERGVSTEEEGEGTSAPLAAPPSPEERPAKTVKGATPPLAYGLTLLALLLGLLAQSVLSNQPAEPWTGVQLYGLALAALLGAVLLRRRAAPRVRLPSLSTMPRERLLYPMSLLLALLAQQQAGSDLSGGRAGAALFLWAAAMALAIYALWPHGAAEDGAGEGATGEGATGEGADKGAARGTGSALVSRRAVLIPLVFLAVALALRLINLTGHPFMLNGVEANLGLEAAAVARGDIDNPFATSWLTNPTLPLFFLALPLQLFGQTVFGVRVLSAVVGAVTVAATYVAGSRLWERKVGVVAAVILAGSHLHVHYSRLGMSNVWDPLWVLLSLGLVIAAARLAARKWWLAAGLAIGLSAYFYTASHLLPLMLGVVLFHFLLMDRERLGLQGRHMAAAGALALVVALPILIYYNGHPGIFMERANVLGIFRNGWLTQEAAGGRSVPALLSDQFWRAALAFHYSVDTSSSYNPGIPLLRFWPAVFLALGIGVAVSRLRRLQESVLLLWLGVTVVFGGALLVDPPASHRLLVAAPAVALLAALGLTWTWRQLLAASPALRRHSLALVAMIAVLIMAGDVVFYFGSYRQQPHRFGDRNTEVAFEMGRYLENLEGEWTAYFHGPPAMYVDFPTIAFLASEFRPSQNLYNVFEPEEALPTPQQPGDNLIFIYLPERSGEMAHTAQVYPGGQQRALAGVFANPLFYTYEVRR